MKTIYLLFLVFIAALVMGQVVVNPPTPPVTSFGLDQVLGNTRGGIAERGAGAWVNLPPGASGLPFVSNGGGADPSYQVLANAGLANMAGGTLKCKPNGATAGAPQDCSDLAITVTDAPYSADPTGTNDSTTAIQNAINALPLSGGDILVPCGTYKISGLTIGNGTSSAGSTRFGVRIRGAGKSTYVPGFNLPGPGCVKFAWNGAANGNMLQLNGPLTGWGLENILFDCSTGNVGGTGLKVISASNGVVENVSVNACTGTGIWSTTQGPLSGFSGAGISNANSEHNQYRDISIINATNVATSKCVFLDSTAADGTTDTDFNTFINTYCTVNASSVQQWGLYLRIADSNMFINTSVFGPCTATCSAVALDYQGNSTFPTANKFYSIDPTITGGGASFVNAGSPGAGASYNSVVDLFEGNFTRYPTRVVNLEVGLPRKIALDVALTALSVPISATSLFTTQRSGMYRVCWYYNTDTVGTAGNINLTFNWADRVSPEFAVVVSALSVTNGVNSGLNTAQGCQAFFIPQTSGLNYLLTFQGVTGGYTYDLYLTAERLD